jgi:hypothetical protein
MKIFAVSLMNVSFTLKGMILFMLFFFFSYVSITQQNSFKEMLNVTCSIEDSGDISYVNTSIAAFNPVNNEIRLISVDEKTVFVLISTNGIVDQSRYSKSAEVNAHFLKTDGIVECSYSWNNNNMKLVLDKTNAKKILINTFGFESTLISNLF